jgi:hypothetical protein
MDAHLSDASRSVETRAGLTHSRRPGRRLVSSQCLSHHPVADTPWLCTWVAMAIVRHRRPPHLRLLPAGMVALEQAQLMAPPLGYSSEMVQMVESLMQAIGEKTQLLARDKEALEMA